MVALRSLARRADELRREARDLKKQLTQLINKCCTSAALLITVGDNLSGPNVKARSLTCAAAVCG